MASSPAKTVDEYLASLPDDTRSEIEAVRKVVKTRLPNGFVEGMDYGMIGYYVPTSRFPETYNGHPLCYAALAAQKNYNAIYLMGVYGDSADAKKFKDGFAKAGKKLDMGKSCVRFKKANDLALDAIGDAIAATTPDEYIAMYERTRSQTKAGQKKISKESAAETAVTKKPAVRKVAAKKKAAK